MPFYCGWSAPQPVCLTPIIRRYVNLSDIQLDIMDYIRPADCKAEDFRSMWAEFEWENKVGHIPFPPPSAVATITVIPFIACAVPSSLTWPRWKYTLYILSDSTIFTPPTLLLSTHLLTLQLNILHFNPLNCSSVATLQVAIITNLLDLREYLDHIILNTNMTCLTPLGDADTVSLHRTTLHPHLTYLSLAHLSQLCGIQLCA